MGKGRDKRKRAKRRKEQGTPATPVTPTGTLREEFSGQERRGDAASVAFKFSGIPVPFDEKDPSANLRERTKLQQLMAQKGPKTVN